MLAWSSLVKTLDVQYSREAVINYRKHQTSLYIAVPLQLLFIFTQVRQICHHYSERASEGERGAGGAVTSR